MVVQFYIALVELERKIVLQRAYAGCPHCEAEALRFYKVCYGILSIAIPLVV